MSMSHAEIGSLVRSAYPDAFLKKAIQGTFAAHRSARELAKEKWDSPEADDTVGWLRRAWMETNFRGAAAFFPDLDAEAPQMENTNWHCTQVRSKGLVMVCKSVPVPGAMVEPSDQRQSLAKTNPPSLFDAFGGLDDETDVEPDADLLVVLTHSRFIQVPGKTTADDLLLPGSLYLGVPTHDFKRYVWDLNLFLEFPDVVRACLPRTWDDEAVVTFLANSKSTPARYGHRRTA